MIKNVLFYNWRNKLTVLWLAILLVAGVMLAAMWLQKKVNIQTNLFALLPQSEQSPAVAQVQRALAEHMDNKLFIVLEADEIDTLNTATHWLTEQIGASDLWRRRDSSDQQAQLNRLFYQQRAGLLAPADVTALQAGQLEQLIERSLLQIVSVGFPITEQLLQDDPLLLFPRYLMQLGERIEGNLRMENGLPTAERNGKTLQLMLLELTASPYQIDYQQQAQTWIDDTKLQLSARGVNSYWTGTLMFTSFGTQSAQQEISTIGLGSSIGLVVLIWFAFRSLRPLATEFIAVSSGTLLAILVTHWLFGEIHLMTLLFGASLIGVSVDFSFYFMAMQSQQRERDGFAVLIPLLPSLFVGLLTTLIAYVFLSVTPFPGFKQIAVFSVVGLSAAWISSVLLLPRLPALNSGPAIARLAFIATLRDAFQRNAARPYYLMLAIAALGGTAITQLQSNDDIRSLQSLDRQLQADDQFIKTVFGHQQAADYVLVSAADADAMQQLEASILAKLDALIASGALEKYQALGSWLPPDSTRQQHIAQLRALPTEWLVQYAQALQLDSEHLLQWQRQLSAPSSAQDSLIDAHPLGFLQVAANTRVIALQGVSRAEEIRAALGSATPLIQPVVQLSQSFGEQRQYAQYLLLAAIVFLGLALAALYGWRSVCPLMAPVSLALLSSFALLALFNVQINLFNIMATFLILGIGVDYAIFYRHGHDHTPVVSMALLLCMCSTLLGFGLLALSNTYAVFSFGVTVLLGVMLSFIYATLMTAPDNHYRVTSLSHSLEQP